MYVAMNRFQITSGREDEFEKTWRERDSHLDAVPGFEQFRLLRGPTAEGVTLYVSHSVWESQSAFEAWTRSESFRKSHANARSAEGVVLAHPQFEGFEQVL